MEEVLEDSVASRCLSPHAFVNNSVGMKFEDVDLGQGGSAHGEQETDAMMVGVQETKVVEDGDRVIVLSQIIPGRGNSNDDLLGEVSHARIDHTVSVGTLVLVVCALQPSACSL